MQYSRIMATTKRTPAQEVAHRAAKDWRRSTKRDAWARADHDLVIDSVCMDQVRAAWMADAETISPDFIMEFRAAFIAEIALMGFHT